MQKRNFLLHDEQYKYMYSIPPKVGRYIVLDTETTGLNHRVDHIIELGAHEISNGRLTGSQFHIYLKPRMVMSQSVIKIHKMDNEFYNDYYMNTYESERTLLESFVRFVGCSLIFAHNAPFDMNFINNELKHFNLPSLSPERFRCSMRIFLNVTSVINPDYYVKCNLAKCCEYFQLKRDDARFHTAIYDSLMTAKMICKMMEVVDSDKALKSNKSINYTSNTIDLFLNKENSNMENIMTVLNEEKAKLNQNLPRKKRKVQLNINESISHMNERILIPRTGAKFKLSNNPSKVNMAQIQNVTTINTLLSAHPTQKSKSLANKKDGIQSQVKDNTERNQLN